MVFFWIVLGSALGGLLRYFVQAFCLQLGLATLGTLFVNTIGSMMAGFVISLTLAEGFFDSPVIRYFLIIGFLGSFTTFSAFSVDILHFLRNSQHLAAISHLFLNVGLSILAVLIGFFAGQQFIIKSLSL